MRDHRIRRATRMPRPAAPGAPAARVPRLRLGGAVARHRRRRRQRACGRQPRAAPRRGGAHEREPARLHRHRPHPLGHARRVTEENAHPHWDTSRRVHIVLNGIVENWTELRDRLRAAGAEFTSETDAEVVAHLISSTSTATWWKPPGSPTTSCAATTRSSPCPPTIRACSWAPARSVRSWSGSARARASSHPRSPPSWPRPAGCSSSTTARSWRSHRRARASSRRTGRRSSERSTTSTGTTSRPRRAATRPSC